MSFDLSKLCADLLRKNHASQSTEKLKASHARELVAAFFGYKSHAALMAEKAYPLENLEEAYIFIPDIPLMQDRRAKLKALPNNLMASMDIAKLLSDFLVDKGLCGGDVWIYETLQSYISEVLLDNCHSTIEDEFSGIMAETNACFAELPYYEDVKIQDEGDKLVITAEGQITGEPLDDKLFCGDTIDMVVQVTLTRMAGKRGFYDFDLEAGGGINDDWVDPQVKYSVPNVRPKEQWLEMTGGFRLGKSTEQFQNRQVEIHAIRNRIAEGKQREKDIERLSHLLGTDQDDEFGGIF